MTKAKMATRHKASRHDKLFFRDTRLWGFIETHVARSCQIANKFASAATLACGVLGAFAPRGEGGEQRSANQGETSPFLIFLYFSGSSGELWNFL